MDIIQRSNDQCRKCVIPVKWRRFLLVLSLAGILAYFSDHIDEVYNGQACKVVAQAQASLQKADASREEIKDLPFTFMMMRQNASVKADVWGNILLFVLFMITPFLLLERGRQENFRDSSLDAGNGNGT